MIRQLTFEYSASAALVLGSVGCVPGARATWVFIDVSGVVVDGAKLPSSAGNFIDDAVCVGSESRASPATAGASVCTLYRLHPKAPRRSKPKVFGEVPVRIWRAN